MVWLLAIDFLWWSYQVTFVCCVQATMYDITIFWYAVSDWRTTDENKRQVELGWQWSMESYSRELAEVVCPHMYCLITLVQFVKKILYRFGEHRTCIPRIEMCLWICISSSSCLLVGKKRYRYTFSCRFLLAYMFFAFLFFCSFLYMTFLHVNNTFRFHVQRLT